MSLSKTIEEIINDEVLKSSDNWRFREPIIGYVSADNPEFQKIQKTTGVWHYKPEELLEDAKTVVVFFLPYAKEIVNTMQREKKIVPEYSRSYLVSNELLSKMSERLKEELGTMGIHVATQPPTDDYDHVNLASHWSHKTIAVMAGLGTFGLNHMLITKYGTAGRLNSIVINEVIEPTAKLEESYCLYYKKGICKKCVERCPSGALTTERYDKKICSAYLDGKCLDLDEQGCPMCMSGPCAVRGF